MALTHRLPLPAPALIALPQVPRRGLRRYREWLAHMRRCTSAPGAPDAAWRHALSRAKVGSAPWIEACARVDAACRAALGITPYDTQWLAAMAMLDGRLAEMATGEGKTLATGLAAAVAALAGRQVHVLTANPYLVRRDAAELAPLLHMLGLTLATADEADSVEARRSAYRAAVVYATARTIVFDALRDEVRARGQTGALMLGARILIEGPQAAPLLPPLDTVLIDEADSVLIDEASTPLIVSAPRSDPASRVRSWQAWKLAAALQPGRDYRVDAARREIHLRAADLPAPGAAWINRRHRDEWLEMALQARHFHLRDQHYVVRERQICLVDPITGRIAEGRQWGRGLHGLIALKEGLPLPPETVTVARTTYADHFRRYRLSGGMSGTLRELDGELRASYGLSQIIIPLRVPCRRVLLPAQLFADDAALLHALGVRVRALVDAGRAVLIGTDTVTHSQRVAAALAQAGIAHRVLNAEQSAAEAEIVAQAGQPGAVTVATSMAGRGTDIRPAPEVARAGGLHVLSLQCNPSPRLDRQLVGRSARQGDPGSAEHWHCLQRLNESGVPLISMLRRVLRLLGERAARMLLPLALALHQHACSAAARRQRSRLRASARYWDRHLPTRSMDIET